MRPKRSRAASTTASTFSVLVTSHRTGMVSTPNSPASLPATDSMSCVRRATGTIAAPAEASASAIWTPRPVEQPVTSATRPLRSK